MSNFKEWSLAKLDKSFGLEQIFPFPILEVWVNGEASRSDFEHEALITFQEQLLLHVHDWNETELAYNFIGPIIALTKYSHKKFNFFAERTCSGIVDGVALTGRPDGIIASGFREPETPYFCFQEYKRETDPEGDPAGQVLAAMLVAQELNEHSHPVYGCYVKGSFWYFLALHEREYGISRPYVATSNELFDIFRILKNLKQIIMDWVQ